MAWILTDLLPPALAGQRIEQEESGTYVLIAPDGTRRELERDPDIAALLAAGKIREEFPVESDAAIAEDKDGGPDIATDGPLPASDDGSSVDSRPPTHEDGSPGYSPGSTPGLPSLGEGPTHQSESPVCVPGQPWPVKDGLSEHEVEARNWAFLVLLESGGSRGTHFSAVARLARKAGWPAPVKDPVKYMSRMLSDELREMGDRSRFRKVKRGTWVLSDVALGWFPPALAGRDSDDVPAEAGSVASPTDESACSVPDALETAIRAALGDVVLHNVTPHPASAETRTVRIAGYIKGTGRTFYFVGVADLNPLAVRAAFAEAGRDGFWATERYVVTTGSEPPEGLRLAGTLWAADSGTGLISGAAGVTYPCLGRKETAWRDLAVALAYGDRRFDRFVIALAEAEAFGSPVSGRYADVADEPLPTDVETQEPPEDDVVKAAVPEPGGGYETDGCDDAGDCGEGEELVRDDEITSDLTEDDAENAGTQ
ncbi:MAG: hypothetical protein Q7U75_12975, partial [Desulfobacterales bacterium]|nr:hypothetical protein [Desulfobacterales bacterium]